MKAEHKQIVKAAELGILRSIEDFLAEPLNPGRLKRKFMEVGLIIDGELRKIYRNNPGFFVDNKDELAKLLAEFGKITEWGNNKDDIHVSTVVSFCLAFLEVSESKYTPKLIEYLTEIFDYYNRMGKVKPEYVWTGRMISDRWKGLKNV